jgi:hypothetical protein
VGWFGLSLLVVKRWVYCLYSHFLVTLGLTFELVAKGKAGRDMRVYKPPFVGTTLGTQRWSLIAWQRLRELRVESAAELKADGVACLDGKKRKSHLDRLKAQIDAGTYHVDSCALAHKMLQAGQGTIL